MKWKVFTVILIFIVPVQTTLMHYLSINHIKPDLALIIVCIIGFKLGEMDGLIMGVLAGMLLDLFSGGIIGTHLLMKPLAGWLSGVIGRIILDVRTLSSLGILMGLSLLSGFFTYFFMQIFREEMALSAAFRWIILPQALYDAILGASLMALLPKRFFSRKG